MKTIIIVLMLLFACFTVIFYTDKDGFLIAGYNTAPKEIKNLYDEKKLNRAYFYLSCVVFMLLGMYYVLSEPSKNLIIVLMLLSAVCLLIYSNTKCKK